MPKDKYLLKNWTAMELGQYLHVLWGNVYGNPKFKDGTLIHTSVVVSVADCGDHKEVETANSIYCIYPDGILDSFAAENPGFYENFK